MKYIFSLLMVFAAAAASGQELRLSQLKSFISRPVPSLSDSLTHTGWSVRPELSASQGHQLYRTFSFGNLKEEQTKAIAWLRIHADNNRVNQLYYQLPGAEQYELLLKEIREAGAEKKGIESIEDKNINTYYVSADYTFQTIVGAGNYTVMVMSNKSL
jgi:hypothetical protein